MNYDPINPNAISQTNPRQANYSQYGYGPIQSQQNYNIRSAAPVQQQNYAPYPKANFVPKVSSRTNVYICGFPTEWTSEDLRKLFETHGSVNEIKVITKQTGEQNRGVAFIHYNEHSAAQAAVESFANQIPAGCSVPVNVRFANVNKNTQPEGMRTMRVNMCPSAPNGWMLESTTNVYVSQLPADITEDQLKALFSPFGSIKSVHLPRKNEKGAIAFVNYISATDALKAVASMDSHVLDVPQSTTLDVRFANINKSNVPDWFQVEHLKGLQIINNLYVSQIPSAWANADQVKAAFLKFGDITEIKFMHKKNNNDAICFIHFDRPISAIKAVVEMNGSKPFDEAEKNILVSFAKMDSVTFERLAQNASAKLGAPKFAPMAPVASYGQQIAPPGMGYVEQLAHPTAPYYGAEARARGE